MRVRSDIGLPVPPPRAWALLLDWERQAQWMRDADEVRVVSRRRAGVGTRVAARTRVLWVPAFTEILEVTSWEPPVRVVMAHRSFVRGAGEWRLEAAGSGCRLTWTEDLSLPIPVLGEAALLAYRPVMRRLMSGALRGLRRLVEREAAT
jgi:Polyketide cyclase / dehydrase and lipid transport